MASNGNLDRTLDSIVKDRKPARRSKPRRAAVTATAKAAVANSRAPTNGIQKNKTAKPVKAVAPVKPRGESKIQVSGLPLDVSDTMLKDYFGEAVGPVKRVILNYGPDGRSRGSATIIFPDATSATKALELDGVRVDNRTLRVEVLASSNDILAQVTTKKLGDRISKPKNAAKENTKPAANKKGAANAKADVKADGKKEGGRKKKSGRAGRPKAKTVDELDAEMADYFGGPNAAANGSAQPAAPAAAADTAMVDEVL